MRQHENKNPSCLPVQCAGLEAGVAEVADGMAGASPSKLTSWTHSAHAIANRSIFSDYQA